MLSNRNATSLWLYVVLTVLISVAVYGFARHLWKEWTLYALVLSMLYFLGAFRFMPWHKPLSKSISIGLFSGLALALLEFLISRL